MTNLIFLRGSHNRGKIITLVMLYFIHRVKISCQNAHGLVIAKKDEGLGENWICILYIMMKTLNLAVILVVM